MSVRLCISPSLVERDCCRLVLSYLCTILHPSILCSLCHEGRPLTSDLNPTLALPSYAILEAPLPSILGHLSQLNLNVEA